ncbi:helix-turn-helix transcriptional regulator [Leucobacter viscericola]|uniref:Helix-turn-helix transcriptional regulator n=1 Tax=Leucobacter viscericola TaxID=2714935 RepID=A0A6G7XJC7_9MICO|nr:helix-turn-helix transcriptional regulator [Leucobacter viscericola]QIK64478.1 helix-turn-helix transcriptional regulator [Leucobacter viscericola]
MNLNDPEKAQEALERALESGNSKTIANVAMANIWPLLSRHPVQLTAAITTLPGPVLERYPVLRVLHPLTPVLARTTHPFKPLVYLDDARGISPEELDFLTVAQIMAFRISGDVAASLVYARRLEHRITQVRVESREHPEGPLWFFQQQIGSTLLAAGNTSRALTKFATMRQLARVAKHRDAERMALGLEALAHAVRGSNSEADRALADAAQLPQPSAVHLESANSLERTAAALVGIDRMDPHLDTLVEALSPYDSVELTWPFALLARCRASLAYQQPEDALEAIYLANAAHPAQHGSFATDVVTAMSVKSFIALGSLTQARQSAEMKPNAGTQTALARVKLLLHECRYEEAGQELRQCSADHALGPIQRAETVLLLGWLELARDGVVDHDTAIQIARIAHKRDNRRLLALVPRQLVDHVATQLPPNLAEEFRASTSGVNSFQMRSQPVLTNSERRVLNALLVHSTTASIAAAFHVSPNTVKTQLKSLYRKLDCSTREEAIKAATRLHLIDVEDSITQNAS